MVVKRLTRDKLDSTEAWVLKDIKQIMALSHNSICKFVGLCTVKPNICYLMSFCTRGSLQVIISFILLFTRSGVECTVNFYLHGVCSKFE